MRGNVPKGGGSRVAAKAVGGGWQSNQGIKWSVRLNWMPPPQTLPVIVHQQVHCITCGFLLGDLPGASA